MWKDIHCHYKSNKSELNKNELAVCNPQNEKNENMGQNPVLARTQTNGNSSPLLVEVTGITFVDYNLK